MGSVPPAPAPPLVTPSGQDAADVVATDLARPVGAVLGRRAELLAPVGAR